MGVLTISGLWGDGDVSSVPASVFDEPDASAAYVSFLEFCSSLTTSGVVVESFRGRPLLRFGESGGFPSSLGEVCCGDGVTVPSGSDTLRVDLGGRPLFLFKGVSREFPQDSAEVEVASLPSGVSVLLDWFPPRPLPRCCCCCCSTS